MKKKINKMVIDQQLPIAFYDSTIIEKPLSKFNNFKIENNISIKYNQKIIRGEITKIISKIF